MDESLSQSEIRQLKSKAQLLEPTLWIGKQGVSDAFIASLHEALRVHELVKVKFTAFKDQKKALSPLLAEKTSSHLILRVGNTATLYRAKQDDGPRTIDDGKQDGNPKSEGDESSSAD
jgi:RNA-binding protein